MLKKKVYNKINIIVLKIAVLQCIKKKSQYT